MIVITSNEGQMSLADLKKECSGGGWAPIQTMCLNDVLIIPCFTTVDVAIRFVRRNDFNKKWLYGCVNITPNDVQKFKEAGFDVQHYSYPHKFSGATFSVTVFELEQEVAVVGRHV